MTNIAQWYVSLDVECPNCKDCFDVLDQDYAGDVLSGSEPLESDVELEVTCVSCGFEFTAVTRY